jgi:hypothetical protein
MFGFGNKNKNAKVPFEIRLQAYIAIQWIRMEDLLALQQEVDASRDPDVKQAWDRFQSAISDGTVEVDMSRNRRGY